MREKETQSKPLQLAFNSCLVFAEEALESCTSLGVYCKYHPLVDIHPKYLDCFNFKHYQQKPVMK